MAENPVFERATRFLSALRHCQVLGLRVHSATPECVEIALPLAPNVNPHGTIFGGAQAATCLVGGWMILNPLLGTATIRRDN